MLKDRSELVAQLQRKTEAKREMIKDLAAAYEKIDSLEAQVKKLQVPAKRTYKKKTTTSSAKKPS